MRRHAALACLAGLAACSPEPDPPANAVTVEVPQPVEAAATIPSAPLAPGELPAPELDGARAVGGTWEVQGATARFGPAGARATFAIRCDREAGAIAFVRPGARGSTIRIVAASGAATYPAEPSGGMLVAKASAQDRFVADTLARADERIAVQIDDGEALALPADPAIGRVVEQCRRPG